MTKNRQRISEHGMEKMPISGHEHLVAVTYPAGGEFARITASTLAGDASLTFTHPLADSERREVLRRAEAVLGWELDKEIPDGALSDAPRLAFLQLLSAGADGVDYAAVPSHVVMASNVGAFAGPMAEHVLAMTLSLAKRLRQRQAALTAGRFEHWLPSLTLDGAVCAILGFGGIGTVTARLMRALGARIYAVNRTGRTSEPAEFTGTLADLDQVLAAADVLVICLPLTLATRGLIGARELALMKPAAIVVNVARGAIIDERALYEHLRAHPDFGAGIDTWWDEPADGQPFRPGHPFPELGNVVGSPHNSAMVPGILPAVARLAAENVRRFLRGEPVTGVVRRDDYAGLR
jgi:phosphoglycerate dehydrogenase-like enzyme